MTSRLEKCEILKDKGFTYNKDTGKIYGIRGKEINRKDKDGYIEINGYSHFKGFLKSHHFAYYCVYKNVDFEQLDHINRDRTDNRISNLRIVTHQENQWNNGGKGYSWDKQSNKWRSQIKLNYKSVHLGLFNTEEQAREAYLQAKKIYHIIKEN